MRVRRPTLATIEFFIYSRAAPNVADVEDGHALNEEHWSYMDRFADGMIARGPTLAADRATWTGSIHIVDLPSAEAAEQFVEREPYNRAGLFEQHLIRRFNNLLGRTMWECAGGSDDPRFMVIAQRGPKRARTYAQRRRPTWRPSRERLIVHGELLTSDEARPAGVVLALQAPTREALDSLLGGGQARLDQRFDVQILDWEFGGRR